MSASGHVRIIGGQWRSRRLTFPATLGLRPTPDRLRETLFNWLQFDVVDSYCWDMFAGSGVLGLEALSRGASQVFFSEKNRQACQALQDNLERLSAERYSVHCGDSLRLEFDTPFDIVFVDPPYHQGLLEKAVQTLYNNRLIHKNSLLVLESERKNLSVPRCTMQKQACSGQANLYLATPQLS
jgi:16S rRNA (guanine966-N2)-methyltransferase